MAHEFVVAIDFDHTIHNPEDRDYGYRMGKPFPGAREALEQFRSIGARIVIHTCRARPTEVIDGKLWEDGTEHVADWLNYFDIPFDEITSVKPVADAYLDDKAVAFDGDWEQAAMEAMALCYLGTRVSSGGPSAYMGVRP